MTLHPGWALLALPQQGRIRPGQGYLISEPTLPAQIAGENLHRFAPLQRWLWRPWSARGKRWAQAASVVALQWGRGFAGGCHPSPGYGTLPLVVSSVKRMPKDQTSDLMVNLPYRAASGAVHLMGNFAPGWKGRMRG